MMWDDKSDQ